MLGLGSRRMQGGAAAGQQQERHRGGLAGGWGQQQSRRHPRLAGGQQQQQARPKLSRSAQARFNKALRREGQDHMVRQPGSGLLPGKIHHQQLQEPT